MSTVAMAEFHLADCALTRFPSNVEQLLVERESTIVYLVARQNGVVLRFPLRDSDRDHLAALILGLASDGAVDCARRPPLNVAVAGLGLDYATSL